MTINLRKELKQAEARLDTLDKELGFERELHRLDCNCKRCKEAGVLRNKITRIKNDIERTEREVLTVEKYKSLKEKKLTDTEIIELYGMHNASFYEWKGKNGLMKKSKQQKKTVKSAKVTKSIKPTKVLAKEEIDPVAELTKKIKELQEKTEPLYLENENLKGQNDKLRKENESLRDAYGKAVEEKRKLEQINMPVIEPMNSIYGRAFELMNPYPISAIIKHIKALNLLTKTDEAIELLQITKKLKV